MGPGLRLEVWGLPYKEKVAFIARVKELVFALGLRSVVKARVKGLGLGLKGWG